MTARVLDAVREAAVAEAAALLREGFLVAFPTETVYGLGADIRRGEAVGRVLAVKGRPAGKPLMLHVDGVPMARSVARWSAVAEALARAFWPGPLTLVLEPARELPRAVLGEDGGVSVRAPSHPVALALIGALGAPLAGTSANRSGHPSPTTAAAVLAELGGDIAAVLDAGPTPLGMESTVLDLRGAVPRILRPGPVSPEELEAAVGLAPASGREVTPGRMAVVSGSGRPIPLLLLGGEPERVRRAVLEEAVRHARAGRLVGFLGSLELAERLAGAGVRTEALGPAARPGEWGWRLFAALRALGEAGVDVILAEEPQETPGATAVRDRLRRAASEVRILR